MVGGCPTRRFANFRGDGGDGGGDDREVERLTEGEPEVLELPWLLGEKRVYMEQRKGSWGEREAIDIESFAIAAVARAIREEEDCGDM